MLLTVATYYQSFWINIVFQALLSRQKFKVYGKSLWNPLLHVTLCLLQKKKFSIHSFIDSTYPTTTNKSNKVTHSLLHSGVLQEARLLRTERRFSINCQLFLHSLSTILSVKCSSPESTHRLHQETNVYATTMHQSGGTQSCIMGLPTCRFNSLLQSPVNSGMT